MTGQPWRARRRTTMVGVRGGGPMDKQAEQDLRELYRTFSKGVSTRRELMRVSAIAAGAVATAAALAACGGGDNGTATKGTGQATQATSNQTPAATVASQATAAGGQPTTAAQGDIMTGAEVTLPFNPYGQGVLLDPH